MGTPPFERRAMVTTVVVTVADTGAVGSTGALSLDRRAAGALTSWLAAASLMALARFLVKTKLPGPCLMGVSSTEDDAEYITVVVVLVSTRPVVIIVVVNITMADP